MKYAILALVVLDTIFANTYESIFFWMDAWDAFSVSLLVRLFMVTFLVSWLVPYKYLLVKSVAFIYSLTYAFDIIQYTCANDPMLPFAVGLSFFVFVPWFIYSWFRSYDVKSEEVNHDFIYFVAHRPDSFSGFLLSLFTDRPLGGSGILVGDTVYLYHRGVFKRFKKYQMPANTVYTNSNIRFNIWTVEYLESMVGKTWHLWRNCVTMKLRMMGHARKAFRTS